MIIVKFRRDPITHRWRLVATCETREVQSREEAIIVYDRINEKPFTDKNEIVWWHFNDAYNCMP